MNLSFSSSFGKNLDISSIIQKEQRDPMEFFRMMNLDLSADDVLYADVPQFIHPRAPMCSPDSVLTNQWTWFYPLDIHYAALLKISEQGFTLSMSTALHFAN